MIDFNKLQPGDRVVRLLSSEQIPMTMTVEKVHEGMVFVRGGWTFDADTGVEIDPDLGWGLETGRTGSVLSRKEVSK